MPDLPPAPQPGLFKHKEVAPVGMGDFTGQLASMSRRMRVLEERYDGLRKKLQVVEQNLLKHQKTVAKEQRVTATDLIETRRDLEDLRGKARLIVKELMDCAKAEDLKVLERYINLWEPMNFVTKKEVDRIVEDKLEELIAVKQNL